MDTIERNKRERDDAVAEAKRNTAGKGTGAGIAAGGVAGAAIGLAGGPVGAAVGAVIGAAAGGLAGLGIAEMVDEHVEDAHWRDSYVREPYFKPGTTYSHYAPAYRVGWEGRVRYDGRSFDESEEQLRADYERVRTEEAIDWDRGRLAARAAWDRIEDLGTTSR